MLYYYASHNADFNLCAVFCVGAQTILTPWCLVQ